jgi:Rieske Fe-S protein
MTNPLFTQRALGGVALAGATVPLLAACGSDEEPSGSATVNPSETASPGESASPDAGGDALVATSEVPVGGGVVIKGPDVVVTQPVEGEFKCFTAICTHQGCVVAGVSDGAIGCECHGSKFSAEDGSVLNGPASKPLEEIAVTVNGGEVSRA